MFGFGSRRLIRLPKHKTFNYKPRHYDPVLDDLHERVSQIKKEMGEESADGASEGYTPNLKFKRVTNQEYSGKTFMLRMLIMVAILLNFVLYLQFGWTTVFQLIVFSQIFISYVWFRFIKPRSKRNSDLTD